MYNKSKRSDIMKRIFAVILAVITVFSSITAFASGEAFKTVSNGDAENGLTNWSTFLGGSIALVQPGADGTANAVKYTPSMKYGSFNFDLGPAIIQDEEYGYNGGGAGVYEVTFWAKSDRNADFNAMIYSKLVLDSSQIPNSGGKSTYFILDRVELTPQWKQYRILVSVDQAWLDVIKGLRNSNYPKADEVYNLGLDLDGATTAFKDDNYFSYYVDQVTIEKTDEMLKIPVGVTIEATDDIEGSTYFISKNGIVKNDVVSGNITKEFTIINNSDEKLFIKYWLQATVKIDGIPKWKSPKEPAYVEIAPGEIKTLSYSMPMNDDNTVTVEGVKAPVEDFFARFDMLNSKCASTFKKGTSITVYGKDEALLKLSTSNSTIWEPTKLLGYDLDGWVEKDGNWYYYFLGEMLADTWCLDENGIFYLHENGILAMNEWLFDGDGWCYVGENGYLVTESWIMDSVGWCYVGEDGYCVTNTWMADSIGWCYLDANGRMATNQWIMDSVGWCYVGSDGYCVTNTWMADSIGWCYLDANGRMATNQWIMDSVGWCYVGEDGYCVINTWMADSVGWCYLDAEGRMVTSDYVYDSNGKCYLDANGYWNGIYY